MLMKARALALLALTLSACGQSGAERYAGYWQQQGGRKDGTIMEIRQEGSNYFFRENMLSENDRQYVLSEKNGELVLESPRGGLPFKLSDDGQSLYFANYHLQRIDAATKDKIVAHHENCEKLADEFSKAKEALPNQRDQAAKNALIQQYSARFAELEQERKCRNKPFDLTARPAMEW